ncbi:hypothetical protein Mal4_15340 [Maioricimonas rarisocia]|uniref:Uncharacterized protein n=1 Tax=Maioricimonas rarisocia TaxID=2528026 RepID=A0A517Z414_9PLAN|nr:hypothetical protein [Maioricimonas rarisocia]QDU37224.1 hypothetical protein Mal4_15340 [Maioricimonas rarisocia]
MIANSAKVALLAVAALAISSASAEAGHRRSACYTAGYSTCNTGHHSARHYRSCRPKRHHRVSTCYQPSYSHSGYSSCGTTYQQCGGHSYSHCGGYSACGSCGSYGSNYGGCPSGACGTGGGYSPAPAGSGAPVEDAPEPPAEPGAAPEPEAAPGPEAAPAPAA